jgi:hypothetical protein
MARITRPIRKVDLVSASNGSWVVAERRRENQRRQLRHHSGYAYGTHYSGTTHMAAPIIPLPRSINTTVLAAIIAAVGAVAQSQRVSLSAR